MAVVFPGSVHNWTWPNQWHSGYKTTWHLIMQKTDQGVALIQFCSLQFSSRNIGNFSLLLVKNFKSIQKCPLMPCLSSVSITVNTTPHHQNPLKRDIRIPFHLKLTYVHQPRKFTLNSEIMQLLFIPWLAHCVTNGTMILGTNFVLTVNYKHHWKWTKICDKYNKLDRRHESMLQAGNCTSTTLHYITIWWFIRP